VDAMTKQVSPAMVGVVLALMINIFGWVWSAATLNASVEELGRTCSRIENNATEVAVWLRDVDRRVARLEGDGQGDSP